SPPDASGGDRRRVVGRTGPFHPAPPAPPQETEPASPDGAGTVVSSSYVAECPVGRERLAGATPSPLTGARRQRSVRPDRGRLLGPFHPPFGPEDGHAFVCPCPGGERPSTRAALPRPGA